MAYLYQLKSEYFIKNNLAVNRQKNYKRVNLECNWKYTQKIIWINILNILCGSKQKILWKKI